MSATPAAGPAPREATLLEIDDLRTWFHTDDGVVRAVDGISLEISAGSTLGLVGESGCGKSVTALSVLRLLPSPPARVESGQVRFRGRDLLSLPEGELRKVRGNEIAMIFQEPMTSLNPVLTCGEQVAEVLRVHRAAGRRQARDAAVELFRTVGIPAPGQRVGEYPHQLSGGMRQRVMIAMALACGPALLMADEPTTALDVTIQAQILDLLGTLQRERGMSMLMITHDLGVVAEVAREVAVMYAGRIVERCAVADAFADPRHPYTLGLLAAIPRLDAPRERLHAIPGGVPDPARYPSGCRFHPRCPFAVEVCRAEEPPLAPVSPGHLARCWRTDDVAASDVRRELLAATPAPAASSAAGSGAVAPPPRTGGAAAAPAGEPGESAR
ncbi:MAG: ABC transporter ATP-binding protein [Candidatus Eisenbacteria bacterium]|nr:ABC transporter ATP-binding protein [Candidatus Eisenbacteria bacterium]